MSSISGRFVRPLFFIIFILNLKGNTF